ncbi:MAG: uroporphyrinogen-III C-methyltransferase [Synergistaceae bacterium]|jgi:uroporphyrinogen III methyltransferase/synthase|nr:uroporphyrinogen-III C-methyltransferase [Synergistaceae bacterium]
MSVTLVGAGCGSPRLLTVAAVECVSRADQIVYDRLIHPDILQLAPGGCEFYSAGKRESFHSLPQDEINALLIKLGRGGGNVVRLKGGDPFVFGRGGEEAEALEGADVEWSAIPGVTAALGGALSVGLPITHRNLSSSATLATGHMKRASGTQNASEEVLREIAGSNGTVALYMGASAFAGISEELLALGKPPGTPVTIVAWGGWGRARRIDGNLADIRKMARDGGLPNPAVIYIGGTAGIDIAPARGSLAGLQVAVCRPYPECWKTGRALEELGADCYGLPLLAMESLAPEDAKEMTSALNGADWLILTSPRGPSELRRLVRDLREIKGRAVAIGESTAAALRGIGIEPHHTAGGSSEDLAAYLRENVNPGESVVFARNERGSHAAVEAAKSRGANTRVIATYRMAPRRVPGLDVAREQWESCGLGAVVFGSSALVGEYARTIGPPPDSAELLAWGAACAESVEKYFGRRARRLPSPDLDGLTEVLKNLRLK